MLGADENTISFSEGFTSNFEPKPDTSDSFYFRLAIQPIQV